MDATHKMIHLLGYASAAGGVNPACAEGPVFLQQSAELNQLLTSWAAQGLEARWDLMLKSGALVEDRAAQIQQLSELLAKHTLALTQQKEFFIVTGGDHTSALGTWSGARQAMKGPLGLIWVDAHMDSHTQETSVSGRYHGMSLAALMGYGDPRFTGLLSPEAKLKPEHVCLIGVRSYEAGEAELLKQLKVRVFFMEEVRERSLAAVFQEAIQIVSTGTVGYGISLDLDSIDPREAPGVDVPEPNGLILEDLSACLRECALDPRLLGLEIVEFNPQRDMHQLTEKAIIELLKALTHYALTESQHA